MSMSTFRAFPSEGKDWLILRSPVNAEESVLEVQTNEISCLRGDEA